VTDPREEIVALFHGDRLLAHTEIFSHRHKDAMPDYQPALVADFHSSEKHILDLVFRGGGKSTNSEEGILLAAGFREFHFCLIIGNTFDRAAQRLHAIRYEIETNEKLGQVFGSLVGPLWGVDQLMLSNGLLIQAMGKGASLLGAKHLDMRPDLVLLDDVEEPSDVVMEKNRDALDRWVNYELLPALDPNYRARCNATPHHPDALPKRLERQGWKTRRVPVYHPGPDGTIVSSWPSRFPLTIADALALGIPETRAIEYIENRAVRAGQMSAFRANYLVEAEAPEDRPFKRADIRWEPRVRTWEPVTGFFDPARTTHLTSAFTGHAAWSWLGEKLVVWDSWSKHLMPDEIVKAIFDFDERFHPVEIGVELDGLEQFLMQPIRIEQIRRGNLSLPIVGIRAPKNKKDFIRGLQPFYKAKWVEHVGAQEDLEAELLAFPSGKIDALNSLAYASLMRGGAAVYGEFDGKHASPELAPSRRDRTYLAVHASRTLVAACLAQLLDGALRIYADWVLEGEPGEVAQGLVQAARLAAGGPVRVIVPAKPHFDIYNVGLRQALAKAGIKDIGRGGDPMTGRNAIRELLRRDIRKMPALMVSQEARWTLAGFADGYKFPLLKQGTLAPEPKDGQYAILFGALEGLMAAAVHSTDAEDEAINYAVTPGGARYETALPQRR
jgi:hypothetical protein